MTRIPAGQGIERRYLHDEVAERLRQLILDGELAPHTRLAETELAERFGISRTPLREAIKILATEGLLELLPNRGARVTSISEKEIQDVVEVMAALEATAAELACRAMSHGEIDELANDHDAMVQAFTDGQIETYFKLNQAIHDRLIAASGNATLRQLYSTLSGRVLRARFSVGKSPPQWERAVAEHTEMIRLLRLRECKALSDLMRSHVRSKKDVIAAAYAAPKRGG